jgi:membrane protease YdiL (CAAX protease family)
MGIRIHIMHRLEDHTSIDLVKSDVAHPGPGANMTELFSQLTSEPALLAGLAIVVAFLLHGAMTHSKHKDWLARQTRPDKRVPLYNKTMLHLWGLAIVTAILWLVSGRDFETLGFQSSSTIGFWAITGLTALASLYFAWSLMVMQTSPKSRLGFQKQISQAGDIDLVKPETPRELRSFLLTSVTAGITEEVVFRGFLITTMALWMPIWFAGLAAAALFILAHAYQGIRGMLQLIPISLVFTIMFIVSGSLWPCIALHILVDIGYGLMMATVQRHANDDAALDMHPA